MSAAVLQGPWPVQEPEIQRRWVELGVEVSPAVGPQTRGCMRIRAARHELSNISVVFKPGGFEAAIEQLSMLLGLE